MDNEVPIKVLTDEEYSKLVRRTRDKAQRFKLEMPWALAEQIVDMTLQAANAIWPWEPDTSTCTATMATREGWQQCGDEYDHDGDHDNGDWTWSDKDTNAYPAKEMD